MGPKQAKLLRLIGFNLPHNAHFDKLMLSLKSKLIAWASCTLSLVVRILVTNQMIMASIWYITIYWNPNFRMFDQICGLLRIFI